MVNNFDLIKENLHFLNKRSFYFIQILKRKKENPELTSYARPIESFYIFSKEDLEHMMPHIIEKCEMNRARAYIKMNCLDAQSVMLENISVITQEIRKGNFHAMARTLNSACGICGKQDGNEKLYLVDLDGELANKRDEIREYINSLPPVDKTNKVKLEVPTKNGYHFLTTGFNHNDFCKKYPNVDIHDDGITLLYFPKCCD